MRGEYAEARRVYQTIANGVQDRGLRALVRNDLAVLAAVEGDGAAALDGFREAVGIDGGCLQAAANLVLVEVDVEEEKERKREGETERKGEGEKEGQRDKEKERRREGENGEKIRVGVLSFLFNWPSTGGGTVHTFELAKFLGRAGYEVRHIYARYPGWRIGGVAGELPYASEALEFSEGEWNVARIQERFRRAVEGFDPDYVIITDSWNMKPLLAEAVRGCPYLLRFQAMECLCPLNNVRLLPDGPGRFRQCHLHQLASPRECARCVAERGGFSGALHQAERALAGVGTPGYHERLLRALAEAEAVLVVNPLHEAMMSPYARCVRVVTAGMDAARFAPKSTDYTDYTDCTDKDTPDSVTRPVDFDSSVSSVKSVDRGEGIRKAELAGRTTTDYTDYTDKKPFDSAARAVDVDSSVSSVKSVDRGGLKTVFFAGLVEEVMKGFDVLHEACARLWGRRRDFELVATGEPAGRVDEFTRFVGWLSQEELPRALRSADIVVVPTVAQEALGRTAVEAMGAGRAVVASRLGGLPFTVVDGGTGLLFEAGNVEDLAAKIERLLDDTELRERLGRAGRRRFEEHYSWEVIIERDYKPLLGGNTKSEIRNPKQIQNSNR